MSLIIGLKSQPGYHPWSHGDNIEKFRSAVLMLGDGLCRGRNLKDGGCEGKVKVIIH